MQASGPTNVYVVASGTATSGRATTSSMCSGSSKWVNFDYGDVASLRCQGSTLYVYGAAGAVDVWRLDGWSCYYSCNYYYSHFVVLPGYYAWLGSPVTVDPSNPTPIEVELVRVSGGPTPPEPGSAAFDQAETIGAFELDPGESADVAVRPDAFGRRDDLLISVISGTVDVTLSGQTQTLHSGQQALLDVAPNIPKYEQTITFGVVANRTFGDAPFTLSASASSGLPVTFALAGPTSACLLSGAVVTITGAGSCSVVASQLGNDDFEAADSVSRLINISRASQSITFGTFGPRYFGDDLTVAATTSSGLAVSFAASGACTATGTTVHLSSVGTCTLTASQNGNANFLAASPEQRSFPVWYAWSGVLQPVNADGSSVFKQGSTIPLKFRLTGASAAVTDLAAIVTLAFVPNGVIGTDVEAPSAAATDSGNTFRYDPISGQYMFNMSSKNLTPGTWAVTINLLDGANHVVRISLKK